MRLYVSAPVLTLKNIVFMSTMWYFVCNVFLQMAERDPDQDGGRSSTRGGDILCTMWEETASVS